MAVTMKGIIDKLNGISSTGLGELADAGLPKIDWMVLPKSFLNVPKTKIIKDSAMAKAYMVNVGKMKDFADYTTYPTKESEIFTAACTNRSLHFKDGGEIHMEYPALSEAQNTVVFSTILQHYSKFEKEDKYIFASFNFLLLVKGWLQFTLSDEIKLIEDKKYEEKDLSDALAYLDTHIESITALCISATLSHWLTNHTIGNMSGTNIVSKTYSFTSFKSLRQEKGAALNRLLYRLVHPTNKRATLYAIAPDMKDLFAVHTYGMRMPELIAVDKSYRIRVNCLPAGNRRLEIAEALIAEATVNNMIICSDAYMHVDELAAKIIKARGDPISCHIGAFYYSKYSPKEKSYKDHSSKAIESIIRSYGSIITAIEPTNTLSMSPIVMGILSSGRDLIAESNAKALIKAYADARKIGFEKVVEELTLDKSSSAKAIKERIEAKLKEINEFETANEIKGVVAATPEELKE